MRIKIPFYIFFSLHEFLELPSAAETFMQNVFYRYLLVYKKYEYNIFFKHSNAYVIVAVFGIS